VAVRQGERERKKRREGRGMSTERLALLFLHLLSMRGGGRENGGGISNIDALG